MTTLIMVELGRGYGDGYGVVEADDAGQPVVQPGRTIKGQTLTGDAEATAHARAMSRPQVYLRDSNVLVPPGAIRRVIGPIDCAEAARVRVSRYAKNWGSRAFITAATDAEITAAASHATERETYAACCELQRRYPG